MIAWLKAGFTQNTWWSRLVFAGLMPLAALFYPLCGKLASISGRDIIWQFPIDNWIPFNKWFILPYFFWYLQVYCTIIWLVFSRRTGRMLHRLILALCISTLIGMVFFLAMPTRMIRPEVVGTDLLSAMVSYIYRIDLPYNCFPSMHVFWATVTARFLALAGPRKVWFRLLNYGSTILIILSTVFVKQHYTPDILGGVTLAWVACKLSDLLFNRIGRRLEQATPAAP